MLAATDRKLDEEKTEVSSTQSLVLFNEEINDKTKLTMNTLSLNTELTTKTTLKHTEYQLTRTELDRNTY